MSKIHVLVFCIFFFLTACGEGISNKQDNLETLKKGSGLFTNYACVVCHSLEGEVIYGPPLNDIYLKDVTVIRKGQVLTVAADREYLKRAIVDPGYEEVSGYESKAMPQPLLSKDEVKILVDYLIAQQSE
jgi:cytochrome c551/c552